METNKITLMLFMLLFLSGCGQYKVEDEYLPLDEALSKTREQYRNIYSPAGNPYFWDLQKLWEQANPEDKEVIEKEMLAFLSKNLEVHSQGYIQGEEETLHDLDLLKKQTSSNEIKTMIETKLSEFAQNQSERAERDKREQQEREREENERVEMLRDEFRKSRERLTQTTDGTLRDKSAQEVKKIVDGWNQDLSLRWELSKEDYAHYFSSITFYKIFGKPEKQQFLAGDYLFYYSCKDGTVQFQVDENELDNGTIVIEELNIF